MDGLEAKISALNERNSALIGDVRKSEGGSIHGTKSEAKSDVRGGFLGYGNYGVGRGSCRAQHFIE